MPCKSQPGFMMVTTMFLLVILSLMASYIVALAALTSSSESMSLSRVRSYFAAASGLEWATYKVQQSPYTCPGASTTFSLTQGGLSGLTALVTCSKSTFTQGSSTYYVFSLAATGSYSSQGALDYAQSTLSQSVLVLGS